MTKSRSIGTSVARQNLQLVSRRFPTAASKTTPTHKLTDPGWLDVFGSSVDTLAPSDYYKSSVWVYACINAIAHNLGAVPFQVYYGDSEDPLEDPADPVYKLFRDVNPLLSRFQLWEATSIFLYLYGEAIWLLEKPGLTVEEIWVFPSSRFTPVIERGSLAGWIYQKGSNRIPLGLDQTIFFKLFNPYDDVRGMPPTAAARLSVDQDYYSQVYNRKFFQNDATPRTALISKEPMGDEEYQRLKSSWEAQYKGTDKAHKVALLEGGLDVKVLSVPNRDMEFLASRKMSREEICAIYKVPPAEVGILEYSKAYANTTSQDKGFWEKTLIPRGRYYEDILNTNFFPVHFPGYWCRFDFSVIDALQEALSEKIKTARELFQMGVPFNSINDRLELGFDPIEGGDIGYLPMNLIPATESGSTIQFPEEEEEPQPPEEEETPEEEEEEIVFPRRRVPRRSGRGQLRSLGQLSHKVRDEMIDSYADDLRIELEDAKARLSSGLRGSKAVPEGGEIKAKKKIPLVGQTFEELTEAWVSMGERHLGGAFQYGTTEAERMLGELLTNEAQRERLLKKLIAWNEKYVVERFTIMEAQLYAQIESLEVAAADAVADAAESLFDRNAFRARSFAGGVVRAMHTPLGAEAAARDLDSIWHVTGDGNECDTCVEMGRGNPWPVKSIPRYPGEDTICNGNCRCYLEILKD